jgi:catechol 2,3-dioxygenase-like lactoylglutathione lyase family enzyme
MNDLGILGLCHIGFAVPDIAEFHRSWGPLLGDLDWLSRDIQAPAGALRLHGEDTDAAFSRVAFARFGDTALELVEPHRGATRTSQWLAEHGPGIHHICLWVANLADALAALPPGAEVSYGPAALCGAAPEQRRPGDFWAYVEMPAATVPWCLELMDARYADVVRARFGEYLVYPPSGGPNAAS